MSLQKVWKKTDHVRNDIAVKVGGNTDVKESKNKKKVNSAHYEQLLQEKNYQTHSGSLNIL